MARPADFLALAVAANDPNTALSRTVRQAAQVQRTAAPMVEQTEKARSAVDTDEVRDLMSEVRRVQRGLEAFRAQTAAAVAKVTVAACMGRRVRSGVQPRASRGRPVRLRGSRRTTTASSAGPEPGDPEPAGPGAPVRSTSRVVALAGRRS